MTEKKDSTERVIVSKVGQPLPLELHEKYGRILKQMMDDLFEMHVEVAAHYGFKKEDRALQKANAAIGKFRTLMDERICAEASADYPATKVYYGR